MSNRDRNQHGLGTPRGMLAIDAPTTRRERAPNYGDFVTLTGPDSKPIFELSKEQADAMVIHLQSQEFSAGTNANPPNFRPVAHIAWGHGTEQNEADVDVCYRQTFRVAASWIKVTARIEAFPNLGTANKPSGPVQQTIGLLGSTAQPQVPVPADATVKIRAFVGEGPDVSRLVPSFWLTQFGVNKGQFTIGQTRLLSLRVFWCPPIS